MQKKIYYLSFCGVLLIAACGNVGYSRSKYEQKLNQWVGRDLNALYDYWGTPVNVSPIDDNSFMVTYYEQESQPIDDDYQPYIGELSYSAMFVPSYGLPPNPPLFYCQTSFIIKNGIVTGYNFNGDDCY